MMFIRYLILLPLVGADIENLVLNSFTDDLIKSKCHDDSQCAAQWKSYCSSLKIVSYYRNMLQLNEMISARINRTGWKMQEGGTLGYHKKSALLNSFADDKQINTICEIGFNSGHSATNFLSANPTATLISFDMFHYAYSDAAVASVRDLFVNHTFITVAGDSMQTLPEFIRNLSHVETIQYHTSGLEVTLKSKTLADQSRFPLCNLIFIDGGHADDVLQSDILNMRRLADPSYHLVIADDYDQDQVKDAVTLMESKGVLQDVVVYDDLQMHAEIEYVYDAQNLRWNFILSDFQDPPIGAICTFTYKFD